MTATQTSPKVTTYNMKVPLLTSGRTNQVLASTDTVEVRAKVYAEGGENGLHCHTDEDHTFFILDGEATFYDPDDRPTVVGRYEGLMIPAGAFFHDPAVVAESLRLWPPTSARVWGRAPRPGSGRAGTGRHCQSPRALPEPRRTAAGRAGPRRRRHRRLHRHRRLGAEGGEGSSTRRHHQHCRVHRERKLLAHPAAG